MSYLSIDSLTFHHTSLRPHVFGQPRLLFGGKNDIIEISPIESADIKMVADFHAYARWITDGHAMPAYIRTSIECGYFHGKWKQWNLSRRSDDLALKVTDNSGLVGFVLCGLIPTPENAPAGMEDAWGEQHHLYLAPTHQRCGFGKSLFSRAEAHLRNLGCDHMLINVLGSNGSAQLFYDRQGAWQMRSIVEHNERGGTIFQVPCIEYVKSLKEGPK